MRDPYILVLGTADWNQPIATNQHYAVRELCLGGDVSVDFLESLGLRRPEFSRRDLARIGNRLARAMRVAPTRLTFRSVPAGARVISPVAVPVHSGVLSTMNRRLVAHSAREWVRSDSPRMLWTYSPITYGLEKYADRILYHCVDLLGEVPGIDREAIHAAERSLARAGAVAAASSAVVRAHLQDVGFDHVIDWPNVADIEVFQASGSVDERVAGRVFFAGNLSPTKVDFTLLEALAEDGLDVRVAGPHAEGGGDDSAAFGSLVDHGVTYLGMLSLPELAKELRTSTVGLIPYLVNSYTMGVSPLKTYEYLAAGLSVVSTRVPAVVPSGQDIVVVDGEDRAAWVAAVRRASAAPSAPDIERRREFAQAHSWVARGRQMRREVRRVRGESGGI